MIISENIHVAQKKYECEKCGKLIFPGEAYFRLFGSAERNDPKYEIFMHLKCRGEK